MEPAIIEYSIYLDSGGRVGWPWRRWRIFRGFVCKPTHCVLL